MTHPTHEDFPGYRILSELEALGDVRRFAALDVRLERRVEIHLLSTVAAAADYAVEFRGRVLRLARLNHPGVAPVHHVEDGAPGRVYCVVPNLLDDTLAARLRTGPLPHRDAVRLANDIVSALVAAHAAGVVGGELDPRTIACVDGRWVATALTIARSVPGSRMVAPEEHGGGTPGHASDIFVAGLVLRDAFGPTARRIAPVLARATAANPDERWPDAAAFRTATRRATRRRRWRAPVVVAVGLAVAYLVGAWRLELWPLRRATPVAYQVAVVPFVAGIGEPRSDARDLARIIQFDLEGVPGLRVASGWVPKALGADSAGDAVAPELITAALVRRLRAEWVVHGRVDRQSPDNLRVAVTLYDRDGTPRALPDEVRGSVNQIASLGDSLARRVLGMIAKSHVARYVPRPELQGAPFPALKSFLRGEELFGRDALARAEQSYADALRADPSFALAEWRLANVQRWRRLPVEPDLPALYRRAGHRLGSTDRRLLEALIEPDLEHRFAILDSAIAADPDDAYARFIYAEELWHRGPLVGRDISEALDMMKSAVAADSALSRAYDHIIMYYIREGDEHAAWRAFEQQARVTPEPSSEDLNTRRFLRLGIHERFDPLRAGAANTWLRWWHDPADVAGLGWVARVATPWLDLPIAQVRLSRILLAIGPTTTSARGSARVGTALGLMAQGQVKGGLAELDSAATDLGTDEMRLQRAEWRLIPPALGLHGWGDGGPGDRIWLESRVMNSVVGARARWSLALGRLGAGDTTGFIRYVDSLPRTGEPLGVLLRAIRAGVGGAPGIALATADSTRQAINVTTPPDPFAPAALHLFAGDWRREAHPEAADKDWQWYLAAEFEGWPSGAPQAGEVDGVMGMLARRRRAEMGLETGGRTTDLAEACRMLRRLADLWRNADRDLVWMAPPVQEERACRQ